MYKMVTIADKVRVSPQKFNLGTQAAVKGSLEDKWEGLIDKNLGVVLAVVDVNNIGEGKILPGDGAIHYPVEFKLLTFYPHVNELVKGNVIDVTEFGVFVRVGPVDGMIHVSQIMNDFVSYDQKNSTFVGRESKRILREGDTVKTRIVSVSLGANQYKIGLTTRQPGLGSIAWSDKAKPVKAAKAPEKKGKKGGPSKQLTDK